MQTLPDRTVRPQDTVGGFVVQTVTPAPEVRARAYRAEHLRSGARILHLHCDDPENLFSINLRTPPPDDTGVPHIIEHAVLAGSRRFPVRDPFFEMIKMSMATFINAMTGGDCTYYPVSSNVKRDLFNLAEVYFDAVFHPLLTEDTFRKEGHHLVPADPGRPEGELNLNGIVFNEMRAAASRPETLLHRQIEKRLFPDSIYGRNAGGDPESIPELTYPDFRRFYELAYHPANAFFLLYGDIPTREYLAFLDDKLASFEPRPAPPAIARQPRWTAPREAADTYPVAPDESTAEKTFFALQWLVGDASDPADITRLGILHLILLGNEGAPLKKAIVESGLGQDVAFAGLSGEGLESTFGVGLKGSEPDRAAAFRDLVLDTLQRLADAPVPAEAAEAAFRQAAYSTREITTMYPLNVLQRVLCSWIYDHDPLAFLQGNELLAACRRQYEQDPMLFSRLIRERLIDNPHRLFLVFTPDPGMQARTDAAFAERMRGERAARTDEQARALAAQAAELERQAGTPNSPEALATLPQLSRRDLPPHPRHIPTRVEDLGDGVTLLHNDVFANGVNYLQIAFDLDGLPAELWPYVPRFTEAVGKLGAAGMGYADMARRIAAHTGGIGCSAVVSTHIESARRPVRGLVFSLKALDEQVEQALDVLRDVVFALDPRDRSRLREVVMQTLAGCRTDLVQHAHHTAMRHAARGLSPEGFLTEQMRGLPQLSLAEEAAREYEARCETLMARIEAVRDFILAGDRLTASFTGSPGAAETVRRALADWGRRLERRSPAPADTGFQPFGTPPREGLAAPIQVAHCMQILPAPHASHADAPLIRLAANLLTVDYMYNEIRFRGNAYGALCRYHDLAGTLTLGSYADPHITRTLKVFAGLPAHVKAARWTQTELDRAVISTAKHDQQPVRPCPATSETLNDYLLGRTREYREARYERIVSATPGEVQRAVLEALERGLPRAPVCVAAGREKLEAANREMPDRPLTIRSIL